MSPETTHRWRVNLKNLETKIGVGIHAHEREKQRIIVNVTVEGIYPAKPHDIADCFNYEYIYGLVVNDWPKKSHKPLLENCVTELLEHIFKYDQRVDSAAVSVAKPDIFPSVETVGVEARWTRSDFEKICKNSEP